MVHAFEKMSRAHESDIVVPHHSPDLIFSGDLECVLEDYCTGQYSSEEERGLGEPYHENYHDLSSPGSSSYRFDRECDEDIRRCSQRDVA